MPSRSALLARVLFLAGVVLVLAVPGFAKMYEEPKSFSLKDKSQELIQRKVLPKVDVERLLAEDQDRGKDSRKPRPLSFAVSVDAALDLNNSGTWQTLADGRLWRLRIHSPGAKSHNLGITRFDMPDGAKLWIYDLNHEHVEGPYTARHRSRAGSLWTPVIEGDEIVVEVFVPTGISQPVVRIGKVNQGYRSLEKAGAKGGLGGTEGACEIDVVCPQGTPWADPIRAVGVYTINGTSICTGTLLNKFPVDFTPYFLSANHCGVNASNEGTVVVYWNFQSATCGTHGPGSLAQNQTGSIFRASYAPSDFLLLELAAKPDLSFKVYHAGWDATGVTPPSTVGIHHPKGDVKAISFSNSSPQPMAYYGVTPDLTGDHWRVDWDSGVTEPGSSGSCLFDTTSQRCIGQLHGGPSFCGASSANLHDFYGRFSVSWNGGGTAATRLKDWLDPGNTGILSMHGEPHNITVSGIRYDFQGAGEFVSLRSADGMEIQTRTTPIATTFNPGPDPYDGLATCVSVNTAVAALVGNHRITIQPNLSGVPDPSGLQVRVDGKLTPIGVDGVNLGSGRIVKSAIGDGFEIAFPNGTALVVTPLFWDSQGKWYLNVDIFRAPAVNGIAGAAEGSFPSGGSGGLLGATAPGSWLPALPDGKSLGPMPGSLHQRYVDLYGKLGEAWRVGHKSSLFDYAPGTSTDTFTMRSWPPEQPPCVIPETTPAKPLNPRRAQRLCRDIRDKSMNANCVFDVRVTGEPGFAKLYLLSQQIRGGSTTTTVSDAKNPTQVGETATFTATVAPRTSGGKGAPPGTVQFTLDGTTVGAPVKLDSTGRATWKTSNLQAGDHRVAARYIPRKGSVFLASSSLDVLHTVKREECTKTVVVSGLHYPDETCAQSQAAFYAGLLTNFHFTSKCTKEAPLKAVFDISCQDAPIPGFPTGSVYQGTACCGKAPSPVTIDNLQMQGGDERTPCPALGVIYKRSDAASVPYLGIMLPSLDQQCGLKGPGLLVATVKFLKCAPDPRGNGFGPNATANITCTQ